MNIRALVLGPVAANCYVVCDEKTGVGAVIDPGDYSRELESEIEKAGIKSLKYILCTHGHFDHVSGVSRLKEKYPDSQIVIGEADALCLSDGDLSAASSFGLPFFPCEADVKVSDGDKIAVGENEFSIVSVPGHTKGGVLYVSEKDGVVFSGDTLFCGSVGRTDLRGGNTLKLLNSLKKIKALPAEWVVYCGHGEATTVGYEIRYNPYMR